MLIWKCIKLKNNGAQNIMNIHVLKCEMNKQRYAPTLGAYPGGPGFPFSPFGPIGP